MFQDMFLCPSKHVDKKRRRQQSSFLELFTNGIQGVFSMKKIKEPRMTNDSSIIWYVPTYLVYVHTYILYFNPTKCSNVLLGWFSAFFIDTCL